MNIQEQIKQLAEEIQKMEFEMESQVIRVKLLKKNQKAFEKLLEKSNAIQESIKK